MPVRALTPADLKSALEKREPLRLIDVRTEREREVARIEPSRLLDRELAVEMEGWDRGERLVFFCHHGIRSAAAANQFEQQGFTNLWNLSGGIDRWSREVDPSTPRY